MSLSDNDKARLLYRLNKGCGPKDRSNDVVYIPKSMPANKEKFLKVAAKSVVDFLNPFKPF